MEHFGRCLTTETEIADKYVVVLVEKIISEFDISTSYTSVVNMNYSIENTREIRLDFGFFERLFGFDEKFLNISISSELHENKSRGSFLHYILSFDDIRMF
jgi:hypothetical protein